MHWDVEKLKFALSHANLFRIFTEGNYFYFFSLERFFSIKNLNFSFLGIGPTWNKEMSRKISTLRQSLLKTEMVCYNIKVRGTEAAKWGNSTAKELNDGNGEDDEGFY